MTTKVKKESAEESVKEREYRFAVYDEETKKTSEKTLKESELTDEHHKAMFYDMWEYFENSSNNAQQLFLLKLEMSRNKISEEPSKKSLKIANKDDIKDKEDVVEVE